MKLRVLALAGMGQNLREVRRMAETGQADAQVLGAALTSIFQLQANSIPEIYGGEAALRTGLVVLRNYLGNQGKDQHLPKLALSVLQLERRFSRDAEMDAKVHQGILAARALADQHANRTHPEVIASLGALYADTISHLRPKVMVQGNPHYLGQASVVAEIRTLLLAALRSAVLWRQLGGSYWDFALRRQAIQQAVAAHLS